jgi:hypothetical protein
MYGEEATLARNFMKEEENDAGVYVGRFAFQLDEVGVV